MTDSVETDIKETIKKGEAERFNAAKTAEDRFRKAEKARDDAAMSLAEFRWHWTRDETNTDRVSQKEYAEITGVSAQQVSTYARGWEFAKETPDARLGDCLLRAKSGEERFAAIEYVARKRGVTLATADAKYREDIKAVIEKRRTDATAAEEAAQQAVTAKTTATVTKITNAKSAKDAKAVKADATKVTKNAEPGKASLSAVPAPATGEVVQAVWEPPTEREVDEAMASVNDGIHRATNELANLDALHASPTMIIDRTAAFNVMIENVGKLSQAIKNLMMAAEINMDDAKIKKAQ